MTTGNTNLTDEELFDDYTRELADDHGIDVSNALAYGMKVQREVGRHKSSREKGFGDRHWREPVDCYEDVSISLDFISKFDAIRMYRWLKYGVEHRLEEYNSDSRRTSDSNEIVFPNERLAILWTEEITGQISDGVWEGHNWNHRHGYKPYCYATVSVDESLDEVEWNGKSLHGLQFRDEMTAIGGLVGRMLFQVRYAGYDDYDVADLMADLKLLDDCTFGY